MLCAGEALARPGLGAGEASGQGLGVEGCRQGKFAGLNRLQWWPWAPSSSLRPASESHTGAAESRRGEICAKSWAQTTKAGGETEGPRHEPVVCASEPRFGSGSTPALRSPKVALSHKPEAPEVTLSSPPREEQE